MLEEIIQAIQLGTETETTLKTLLPYNQPETELPSILRHLVRNREIFCHLNREGHRQFTILPPIPTRITSVSSKWNPILNTINIHVTNSILQGDEPIYPKELYELRSLYPIVERMVFWLKLAPRRLSEVWERFYPWEGPLEYLLQIKRIYWLLDGDGVRFFPDVSLYESSDRLCVPDSAINRAIVGGLQRGSYQPMVGSLSASIFIDRLNRATASTISLEEEFFCRT